MWHIDALLHNGASDNQPKIFLLDPNLGANLSEVVQRICNKPVVEEFLLGTRSSNNKDYITGQAKQDRPHQETFHRRN